jgi:hypothetical protein
MEFACWWSHHQCPVLIRQIAKRVTGVLETESRLILQLAVVAQQADKPPRCFPQANEPLNPWIIYDSRRIDRIK